MFFIFYLVNAIVIHRVINSLLIMSLSSASVMLERTLTRDKQPVEVNLNWPEKLNYKLCARLVCEVIKYIAYQKQQIPYPYEYLRRMADLNGKHVSCNSTETSNPDNGVRGKSHQTLRYYKKVSETVQLLDSVFKQIEEELQCREVEEIAMLIGATPVCPKDTYRIVLPKLSPVASDDNIRLTQRCMIHLIRTLVSSEDLHQMMERPVSLTNTYILLKKKNHMTSDSLLPKQNFCISPRSHQAVFHLQNGGMQNADGHCRYAKVQTNTLDSSNILWFQVPSVLKGFRDSLAKRSEQGQLFML